MRGVVRAFPSIVLFSLLLLPLQVIAQERQLVVTEGADYFGADYDILRDVDLDACQAACLDDARCQAFTFNNDAGWCFLKDEVGALRTVESATSGRIAVAEGPAVDVEAERIRELTFVDQAFIDEARRFVGRLSEVPTPSLGLDAAIADAQVAASENDYLRAADLYRAALSLAPERFDLWTAYTDAAIRASSNDWEIQRRIREDRTAGALNAYLRAVTEGDRAYVLRLIGWSLADRYEWKAAIRAYRASLALVEHAQTRETYDRIVAEHGFRIVDHDIEADAAAPRICLNFSDRLATSDNLADYVSVEGGANLPVEAGGQQICIDGVEHGRRYRVTAREGLPTADGERLTANVTLELFVRDRAPSVRFLGNAYVLPAGGEPTIPVVTVNTNSINAELFRIGDRQLADAIADGTFLSQLSEWERETIEERSGVKVWEGTVDVASEINREMTTAIPVGELESALAPGAYVLTARAINDTAWDWSPRATQWFVVTDLGITTLSGNDGLHVMIRSLGTAGPVGDVGLRLVAVNNEVLGEATTDAAGYASFAPGLMRGTGGMAPGLLVAETDLGDYAFIDLSRAPMDLTDRGVEGRAPPLPLDVFLTTERGIYRAGETVHATTLVRDATAHAVRDVPLTAVVTRPDGKEAHRDALTDQGLGGSVLPYALAADAMLGTWRIAIHTDVEAPPLAEATFLVEDFQPERLDFDLETAATALDPAAPAELSVDARFLYGAPAAALNVEGEAVLSAARELDAYPGYVFGLSNEPFTSATEPLDSTLTDEAGQAIVSAALPGSVVSSRPLEATINVRVLDTGGRPVERGLTLPVLASADRLGVKPLFEGAAAENGPVAFELIAVDPDGARTAHEDITWSLYQLRTQFQWFRSDGRWNYERIETKTRVANGTLDLAADRAARIEAAVEWGSYRLEVDARGGTLPASFDFEAGWYVEAKALDTPEALKISLDRELYAPGETANVHIETRFNGLALVMVVDDRLIATHAVEVTENGAEVEIPVTRDWGPGAYVTAVLYRPMDIEAKRMPARAIGLAWAGIDPGARDLDVVIEAADEMRPRRDMPVSLTLADLPAGTEAYVTLAAVDLGILNLTRYETPDPEAYYFGRRSLGMAIRDVYNQLVDRMQGVRGTVRSGGDASFAMFEGEAPTETLVAFHSGIVTVDDDGTATLSVPIPDFNGTLRLMAMAWTAAGVGHAERDVLVRDPVVVTASLPHFLAPGDRSRLALDLASVEDVAGTVAVAVETMYGFVGVDPMHAERTVSLAEGTREQVLIPITGEAVGSDGLAVAVTLPDGTVLNKAIGLDVRLNAPPAVSTDFITLQPGADLSITADRFDGLVPGTATVEVSASGAGRLNVAAILRALDRYPYGCTEQITSRAMPLVYLNDVAIGAGFATDPEIRERVKKAIAGVLGNQSAEGSFGLWSANGSGDLWLSAYVTDFLTRARQNGYDVPRQALELALDNLKNRLAYASDFEHGGEDIAYALYVLAANGRAAIGDLRYYAEAKLDAFATPLAKAQIGAALALYGERLRADTVFRRALGDLPQPEAASGWRSDYGTPLRDGAAILTLASEARAEIDLAALAGRVAEERLLAAYTSTQEDAWSLLAAHALMQSLNEPSLIVDGEPAAGPLFRSLDAEGLAISPLVVANTGDDPVEIGVSVSGVPEIPEPAGGNFYSLTRSVYTLNGEPANLAAVEQGTRLVVVLDVVTNETAGARLILDDPLPAGFEIDNPHILASGDIAALDWLQLVANPAHVEFRADRFIAAWDLDPGDATQFQFAYVVRAISPGTFLHPAALVEDMYRPERRARTDTASVEIVGPLR